MKHKNFTLEVRLIDSKDKPKKRGLPEFLSPQNSQKYVEGRPGSRYGLYLRNNTVRTAYRGIDVQQPVDRHLFQVSVDGLDILTGEPAGAHKTGYEVMCGAEVFIPGWSRGNETAAAFVFADLPASYAAQMAQDTANVGVIGVRIFPRIIPKPITKSTLDWKSTHPHPHRELVDFLQTRVMYSTNPPDISGSIGIQSSASAQDTVQQQSVGTGYGDEVDFKTTTTSNEYGDCIAEFALFYGTRSDLLNVGIDLSAPQKVATPRTPTAFPGGHAGCPAPAGWTGAQGDYD